MFYSYIVHDVVEIEPVYLPTPTATLTTSTAAAGAGAASGASHGSNHTKAPGKKGTLQTSNGSPQGEVSAAFTADAANPLIKALFGSLDALRDFLAQQRQIRAAHTDPATSASPPDADADAYRVTITDALLHRLTEKYVGRVLPNCGLCVAIRDVLECSPAEVRGPSASAWVGVVLEICVLAPGSGTRLRGRIAAHTRHGLYLTVIDFLAGAMTVYVSGHELIEGSCYDKDKGLWYLPLDDEESGSGGNTAARNYYLVGETVMCKVLYTSVRDEHAVQEAMEQRQRRAASEDAATAAAGGTAVVRAMDMGEEENEAALMLVTASFRGDGLGPSSWFAEDAEAEAGL